MSKFPHIIRTLFISLVTLVLTLSTGLTLNASAGTSSNPNWLEIKVASGGVTLNSGSVLYGRVIVPSGMVTINSRLVGNVIADRLTINSGGVLQIVQADTTSPAIQQAVEGLTNPVFESNFFKTR